MKQHKKNLGLMRVNLSIPKELYEWLTSTAAKHDKTQSLYLTEILELVKKLQDHA